MLVLETGTEWAGGAAKPVSLLSPWAPVSGV